MLSWTLHSKKIDLVISTYSDCHTTSLFGLLWEQCWLITSIFEVQLCTKIDSTISDMVILCKKLDKRYFTSNIGYDYMQVLDLVWICLICLWNGMKTERLWCTSNNHVSSYCCVQEHFQANLYQLWIFSL